MLASRRFWRWHDGTMERRHGMHPITMVETEKYRGTLSGHCPDGNNTYVIPPGHCPEGNNIYEISPGHCPDGNDTCETAPGHCPDGNDTCETAPGHCPEG